MCNEFRRFTSGAIPADCIEVNIKFSIIISKIFKAKNEENDIFARFSLYLKNIYDDKKDAFEIWKEFLYWRLDATKQREYFRQTIVLLLFHDVPFPAQLYSSRTQQTYPETPLNACNGIELLIIFTDHVCGARGGNVFRSACLSVHRSGGGIVP